MHLTSCSDITALLPVPSFFHFTCVLSVKQSFLLLLYISLPTLHTGLLIAKGYRERKGQVATSVHDHTLSHSCSRTYAHAGKQAHTHTYTPSVMPNSVCHCWPTQRRRLCWQQKGMSGEQMVSFFMWQSENVVCLSQLCVWCCWKWPFIAPTHCSEEVGAV